MPHLSAASVPGVPHSYTVQGRQSKGAISGKKCLQPRLEMSWRVDEAESWGSSFKGRMLEGVAAASLTSALLACGAWEEAGIGRRREGGAGSKRELKTELRTGSGLSYNFRN